MCIRGGCVVPTDPLTPDELVRLAVYCGREAFLIGHILWVGRDDVNDRIAAVWQPHLDANQRDELEDAVIANGHKWQHHSCKDGYFRSTIKHVAFKCWRWELVASAKEKTRGLAVCRAALKVIGGG